MKQEFEDAQFGRAALVARRVTLEDVYARSVEARLACSREAIFSAANPTTSYGFDATYSYSRENGILAVTVALNLTAHDEQEGLEADAQPEILSVDIELVIEYSFDGSGAPETELDELFRDFAAVNGLYNAWPYLRETVQSVTSRMGIPPYTLPVLHLVKVAKPAAPISPIDSPETNETKPEHARG